MFWIVKTRHMFVCFLFASSLLVLDSGVAYAQLTFDQAYRQHTARVQHGRIAVNNAASSFQNAKARERQAARAWAMRNQQIIAQQAWQRRRAKYLTRLENHRAKLVEEWKERANNVEFESFDFSKHEAVVEAIAGIATIAWAEDLTGKNNDMLWGVIAPAALESFGTELIKDSARKADLDENLVNPACVAVAETVKALWSDEPITDAAASISNRTAFEIVLDQLEEVDPSLRAQTELAREVDILFRIAQEKLSNRTK